MEEEIGCFGCGCVSGILVTLLIVLLIVYLALT